MKKIWIYTGIIILTAIVAVSLNWNKSEKKALQTLKTFEEFVEVNELDIFEYQIDSKQYSVNGHYTFDFIRSDIKRRIAFSQWRNVAFFMGKEFDFSFSYEGEPSFEGKKIISLSKPYERWQRYRVINSTEETKGVPLEGENLKEFYEELSFHLNSIMSSYSDTANFCFERIIPRAQIPPSFWRNEDILLIEGGFEPSGR